MDLRERTGSAIRHPWETARAAHVAALLRDQRLTGAPLRVLDAGSGDSFVGVSLLERFPQLSVTCWDINYTREDIARSPSGVERTSTRPEGTFDIVLALDVIEHVQDDVGFLNDLRLMTHPAGTLVVTVPAYQWLFSDHDVFLHHYRRYSRGAVTSVLLASGWSISRMGGFFSSLLLWRSLAVLLSRSRKDLAPLSEGLNDADHPSKHLGRWDRGPRLTSIINRWLATDAALGRAGARRRHSGVPGLSIFAVASPGPTQGGER